jgi:hypothetical protein
MGWRAEKIDAKRAAGLCVKLSPDRGNFICSQPFSAAVTHPVCRRSTPGRERR